ncbi:hypothetical protein BsWGS_01532 [Bradybaena similaris]
MSSVTLQPIGIMKSVFHFKNGTPRQPSLCGGARGVITIDKSIFNNPEHSLEGLEQFSHAWVVFVFHKNNNICTKAKVKPPRLNGQRVGVFSTRSPYRPNNIGLSLVKIDKVEGASVYVSGIDILDGSPVLDIKPYIPEYDKPKEQLAPPISDGSSSGCHVTADVSNSVMTIRDSGIGCSLPDQNGQIFSNSGATVQTRPDQNGHLFSNGSDTVQTRPDQIGEMFSNSGDTVQTRPDQNGEMFSNSDDTVQTRPDQNGEMFSNSCDTVQTTVVGPYGTSNADNKDEISQVNHHYGKSDVMPDAVTIREKETSCTVKGDLGNSCVAKKRGEDIKAYSDSGKLCGDLEAQTAVASWLLNPPVAKLHVTFTSQALEQLHKFSKQSSDLKYQFEMFSTAEEAAKSIADILREEPRSVYRRQHCQDSLYYFAVDVLHVTCWFDENIAQVVRIKPVASVPMLQPIT